MRALIADLVVEFTPRYDNLIHLAAPFRYDGNRKTDLHLAVSDKSLSHLMRCASFRTNIGQMETHAFSGEFNRLAMEHNVMLLHSSALVYDGGAYLFSAPSGGGKSTHTRLWLQTFGDRVRIMNDDKPALRLDSCQVLCCGTPFDGGSGIALNETFPLKAIVFLNKGENNSVHIPTTGDILRRIFFSSISF